LAVLKKELRYISVDVMAEAVITNLYCILYDQTKNFTFLSHLIDYFLNRKVQKELTHKKIMEITFFLYIVRTFFIPWRRRRGVIFMVYKGSLDHVMLKSINDN
jgi:hypothetical protein